MLSDSCYWFAFVFCLMIWIWFRFAFEHDNASFIGTGCITLWIGCIIGNAWILVVLPIMVN